MMIRSLSLLVCLCVTVASAAAADPVAELNASIMKEFPSAPEENGLRLEVNAHLNHTYGFDDSGMVWDSAFLTIEVALHNVSANPITVATTAHEMRPMIHEFLGMQRILLWIQSSTFQRKPTAFVSAHFTPVTILPGEYVLLVKHHATIKDRKRADAITEASVHFNVSKDLNGPKEWWRGRLIAYAPIVKTEDPEQYIVQSNAGMKRYAAQKEAENDPVYGPKNAARVAALIASSDQVSVRGEGKDRTGEILVRDLNWIRRVSEALAAVPLPRTVTCLCTGWRTLYFQKGDKFVVSIAAIHGNQLRINWPDGGGDYEVSEAEWNAIKQALEPPGTGEPRP